MPSRRLGALLALPFALLPRAPAVDVDGRLGGDTLSPGDHEPIRHSKLMRQEMRAQGFAASSRSNPGESEERVPGPRSEATSALQRGSAPEPAAGAREVQVPNPLAQFSLAVNYSDARGTTACPEVVILKTEDARFNAVHSKVLGVYHLFKTTVFPPIYINNNKEFYMYYVGKNQIWRVGRDYTDFTAAITSNPGQDVLCPQGIQKWFAIDDDKLLPLPNSTQNGTLPNSTQNGTRQPQNATSQPQNMTNLAWTPKYNISVVAEQCQYQLRVTGAEQEHPKGMGIFSMLPARSGKRPVYVNSQGRFLSYCESLESWRIGSNASNCSAAVSSNATANNACPVNPEAWCVWKKATDPESNGTWKPKAIVIKAIDPVTHLYEPQDKSNITETNASVEAMYDAAFRPPSPDEQSRDEQEQQVPSEPEEGHPQREDEQDQPAEHREAKETHGDNTFGPNMTVASGADAEASITSIIGKEEKEIKAWYGGFVLLMVLHFIFLLVCCGCSCCIPIACVYVVAVHFLRGKTDAHAVAKDKIVDGQTVATPTMGDYVLVISLGRYGWVAELPDAQWRYKVTFEDDNSVSGLLAFEDIQLAGQAVAAIPAAN